MHPYAMDRRRLLMLVRGFTEELLELVDPPAEDWRRGGQFVSRDQLDAFIAMLDRRSDEDDELSNLGGNLPETEAQVMESLLKGLQNLVRSAPPKQNWRPVPRDR